MKHKFINERQALYEALDLLEVLDIPWDKFDDAETLDDFDIDLDSAFQKDDEETNRKIKANEEEDAKYSLQAYSGDVTYNSAAGQRKSSNFDYVYNEIANCNSPQNLPKTSAVAHIKPASFGNLKKFLNATKEKRDNTIKELAETEKELSKQKSWLKLYKNYKTYKAHRTSTDGELIDSDVRADWVRDCEEVTEAYNKAKEKKIELQRTLSQIGNMNGKMFSIPQLKDKEKLDDAAIEILLNSQNVRGEGQTKTMELAGKHLTQEEREDMAINNSERYAGFGVTPDDNTVGANIKTADREHRQATAAEQKEFIDEVFDDIVMSGADISDDLQRIIDFVEYGFPLDNSDCTDFLNTLYLKIKGKWDDGYIDQYSIDQYLQDEEIYDEYEWLQGQLY